MSLFRFGDYTLHSGLKSKFLIDCSKLTQADWKSIAAIVGPKLSFSKVVGIPVGGLAFAKALFRYKEEVPVRTGKVTLVVDDVLTTGKSIEEVANKLGTPGVDVLGIVLFARGECPNWVLPVFTLNGKIRI